MQLTRFTDLGLRVLMYLSAGRSEAPATVGEIAERFAVSHHHLVKVVNLLGQSGWITATRGRGGGLRLAVAPSELRLGAVVRRLEATTELIDCAEPPCVLRGDCRLKAALDAASDAFFAALDGYTLADVVAAQTGERLLRLHALGRPSA